MNRRRQRQQQERKQANPLRLPYLLIRITERLCQYYFLKENLSRARERTPRVFLHRLNSIIQLTFRSLFLHERAFTNLKIILNNQVSYCARASLSCVGRIDPSNR